LNSACFNDITHGSNGAFRGRTGADPCTGLGSPIGASLEERIQPATIHASTMRNLLAENEQLRATVASLQIPRRSGLVSGIEKPPALLPRDITAPAVTQSWKITQLRQIFGISPSETINATTALSDYISGGPGAVAAWFRTIETWPAFTGRGLGLDIYSANSAVTFGGLADSIN
jgi:hypothetical protein